MLVNPNGIAIGFSDVINASNATYSTLAVTNDAFLNRQNKDMAWTMPAGKAIAAPIRIDGAKLNFTQTFELYGGTVYLDDVTINAAGTTHDNEMEIHAISARVTDADGFTLTATPENLVPIKNTTYTNAHVDNGGLNLYDGKVSLDSLDVNGQCA